MPIPSWLLTDIRSGIISAIISVIISALIAVLASSIVAKDVAKDVAEDIAAREKKFVAIRLNEQKQGYPAVLFDAAEKEGYTINFNPPELKKVAVCEYYPARGATFADLALNYLAEYAACFTINRTAEKTYEISPNDDSGALIKKNANFFCKCQN